MHNENSAPRFDSVYFLFSLCILKDELYEIKISHTALE